MIGLLSAGLGVAGGLNQMFTGWKQRRMANKMNPIRPAYDIPQALQENVAAARQAAGANMPGYGVAQNNLQAGVSNAARAAQMAGSSNNALATIAAAQNNAGNSQNDLATQNAQFQMGQAQNLQGQLGQLAGQQQAKWDWEKKQKFEADAAAKSALQSASMQNMQGGLNNISNLAIASLTGKKKDVDVGETLPATGAQSSSFNPAFMPPQTPGLPGFNMSAGLRYFK